MYSNNVVDLTNYPKSELCLIVFNDENLYNIRHKPELKEVLQSTFVYREDQWEELQLDLIEDLEEITEEEG